MNPEGPDALMLQTRLRERDGADKESLQDSDNDEDEHNRSESGNDDENDNVPSTLGVKMTRQMMSFLLLSMTRKKLRGQQRHALQDP